MTEALFDSLFWSLVWQTLHSVFQMFQIQDGGDAYFPADERQSTNPLPPSFYILSLSFPVTPVPLPLPPPRGGWELAHERGGNPCRKFWITPLKETHLGVALAFLTSKTDRVKTGKNMFLYFFACNPKRDLHGYGLHTRAFCSEYPIANQIQNFTPLSEKTSIPAPVIYESPSRPPYALSSILLSL